MRGIKTENPSVFSGAKKLPPEEIEISRDKSLFKREVLLERKIGSRKVRIFCDFQGTIHGSLYDRGKVKQLPVYGTPKEVTANTILTAKDSLRNATIQILPYRIEVWPKLLGGARSDDEIRKKPEICRFNPPTRIFTGRTEELKQLKEALNEVTSKRGPNIVVISGAEGIGKTELMNKFVSENFREYTLVWTLDSRSEDLLNESFRALGNRLKVGTENVSPTDVRKRVNDRLQEFRQEKWLLLFDGLDDPKLLWPLEEMTPEEGGHIVITSRTSTYWKGSDRVIEITGFKRQEEGCIESICLLKKIIPENRRISEKSLDDLASELSDMPLALVQAGGFIKRKEGESVEHYLERFRLERESAKHSRVVVIPFRISNESIRQESELIENALHLFAYLNDRKIPTDWLESWLGKTKRIENTAKKAKEVINVLRSYEMIDYDEEKRYIYISRTLQQMIKENLTSELQEEFLAQAMHLGREKLACYQVKDPKTWKIGQISMRHSVVIISVISGALKRYLESTPSMDLEEAGSLFHQMGAYAKSQGNAFQARIYFESALRIYKYCYWDEHFLVGELLNDLGEVLSALGKRKESVVSYTQAVSIYRDYYNETHPKVAFSLNNLGTAKYELGEYKQAIECYEEALRIYQGNPNYGENCSMTAFSLNNLGVVLHELGEERKAIAYYEKALHIYKTNPDYGDNHPEVAHILVNLAEARNAQKNYSKAFFLSKQALTIFKQAFGDEHPFTTKALNLLGAVKKQLLRIQMLPVNQCPKNSVQAKRLFLNKPLGMMKKSFSGIKDPFVADIVEAFYQEGRHPLIAQATNNLGNDWSALGEHKKAIEEYFTQALEIYKSFYGNNHPSVADTLNYLGNAWKALGENEKATKYYTNALEIREKFYGHNHHPDVVVTCNNLRNARGALGENKKTAEFSAKALEMKKSFSGIKDPFVADIVKSFYQEGRYPLIAQAMNDLGNDRSALGEHKKAIEEYFIQALKIYKSFYGNNHPSVADTLNYLGNAWKALSENEKAMECYTNALEIKEKFHGRNRPNVARILNSLGAVWSVLGENEKAIDFYSKALAIFNHFYPNSHPDVVVTCNNLRNARGALGENKKTAEFSAKALEMKKSFSGIKDPFVADIVKSFYQEGRYPLLAQAMNDLGNDRSALGEHKKAIEEYFIQALEIYKSFYGNNHPSVADTSNYLGNAWKALGENEKAMEYYTNALEIREKFYGRNHPNVAGILNSLGAVWSALGENEKAIDFYSKALAIFNHFYPNSHPDVVVTCNNLRNARGALGENKKTAEFSAKALEMKKSFSGIEDPFVADIVKSFYQEGRYPLIAQVMNDLGNDWSALGEHKKAIEGYFTQALEIYKFFYGNNHPLVADTLNYLGNAWRALGENEKARGCYTNALKIRKNFYGNNHPDVAGTLNNLGAVWSALGGHEEAVDFYSKAMAIFTVFYPNGHPDVAATRNNLKNARSALAEHKKTAGFFDKALEVKKSFYDSKDSFVAKTLEDLKNALSASGKNEIAMISYKEVMEMSQGFYDNGNHLNEANILNRLGNTWRDLGENEKAIECYKKVLNIQNSIYGESYILATLTLRKLWNAYEALGERENAINYSIQYYEQILNIRKRMYGANHPSVASSLKNLGRVFDRLGKNKEALACYKQADEITSNCVEEKHSEISQKSSVFQLPEICKYEEPADIFTGRNEELKKITEKLQFTQEEERIKKTKIVVLSGLGGIGKTQLACKFIKEHLSEYNLVWVFNAESEVTLRRGYRELAERVKCINEGTIPLLHEEVLAVVNNWLETPKNYKWFLCFDNVSSPEIVPKKNLPKFGGQVLITSRTKDWTKFPIVEISELKREESVTLLGEIIPSESWDWFEDLEVLSQALGDLPLALVQAGNFIKDREMRISDYLQDFRREWSNVWKEDQIVPHYPKTVATTWNVELERLQKESPLAMETLGLLAYFDSKQIPFLWIEEWLGKIKNVDELKNKETQIITLLSHYSMIRYDEEDNSVFIPPLIQCVVQDRLTIEKKKELLRQALSLVNGKFEGYDSENAETKKIGQECFLHAVSVASGAAKMWEQEEPLEESEKLNLEKVASLFHRSGLYLYARKEVFEAKEYYEKALRIRETIYENKHFKVVEVLKDLGVVWSALGENEKAIGLFDQAIEIYETLSTDPLNKNSRLLVIVLNERSNAWSRLGNSDKAKESCERALEICIPSLGNVDLLTAETLSHLAKILSTLGEIEKAAECCKVAGDTYKNNPAWSSNPKVENILSNLGEASSLLGKKEEALEWDNQTLSICAVNYGVNHPKVASIQNRLGVVSYELGKFKEAKEHHKKALDIYESIYRSSNPFVAETLDYLARACSALGENKESIEFYQAAMSIYRADPDYGSHHPKVLQIESNLSNLYVSSEGQCTPRISSVLR